MIKLGNIGVTLICDIEDAVAHKRSEGWKSEKHKGEWEDVCPECQEG